MRRQKINVLNLFRPTFLFTVFQKLIGIIISKKFIDADKEKGCYEIYWGIMNTLEKAFFTLYIKYDSALTDEMQRSQYQPNEITERLNAMLTLTETILHILIIDRLQIPNDQKIEFRQGFKIVTTPYTQEYMTGAAIFLSHVEVPANPQDGH